MSNLPKVSHYGTIRIGDLAFDGVVLEDGTRGYVQRQLLQAVGFHAKNPGNRIGRMLAEIAPNALKIIEKSESPRVVMPHGGYAAFLPAGILSEIVTGEVALIDEATGYQFHRAPDALQDLFGRLIRETCADWERRFHPEYYRAIFRLFGLTYTGQSLKPSVVGQITERLVYGAVFPADIMAEVRERRAGRSDKLHQWLKDGGLKLLEHQIAAVTMMANSSADYADFNNRCTVAFPVPGQLGFVFPAPGASA